MKRIQLTVVFLALSIGLSAQSDMMLYNFNAIPQSHYTNPAMPQQAKWYIGLPAISGISTHYHNSGFSAADLFEAGTNINDNLAQITANLDSRSQLNVNNRIELLGIGFKVGDGFVNIGANQSVNFTMDIPYQLFDILFSGGGSLTNLDLNEFDLEVLARTDFYLGYQHRFLKDRLTLGVKAKYIYGQQHAYIDRINLKLENDGPYRINAVTDILVRSSGPSAFENFDSGQIMELAMPNNTGFAFDFGAHYKINDHFDVSASLLDLGSITYNDNNRDYISKGEFEFDGIDFDLSQGDFGQAVDDARDSLEAAFNFREEDGNVYSRDLMRRAFVSVNYHINDKHSFGALFHTRIWNGEYFNDYGVNYVGRLSRTFQFTTGYSLINGTQHNIGAGFDLKLGPFQLYLMTDNALAADYASVQTTNFRFGINLTFYGKREKKKEKQEEEKQKMEETEASMNHNF
jgi:hypothetical protein